MRMMDKERRKKKNRDKDGDDTQESNRYSDGHGRNNGHGRQSGERDAGASASYGKGVGNDDYADDRQRQKSSNDSNASVHTEIRTDDFVVRLLLYQVAFVTYYTQWMNHFYPRTFCFRLENGCSFEENRMIFFLHIVLFDAPVQYILLISANIHHISFSSFIKFALFFLSHILQLVVKKSETDPTVVLNGRAALCAGRDDMSSEDESTTKSVHRFRKPSNLETMLESGAIPDAAMIHEARKKRQQARELGDFVAIEDPKVADNKKGRLIREDAEDDASDDERVDMSAITGVKEYEERREQFYAIENEGNIFWKSD